MDPQVAWNELLLAVANRKWKQAEDHAENLLEWMHKGGFPPQTTKVEMQQRWNRAMAEFGCLIALQYVQAAKTRKSGRR